MNPRDFLTVADEWTTGAREAEWRSAVSRGYYAAFHVARQLLEQNGFAVPDGPQGHGYLWLRLANAGQPDVVTAGNLLNTLRGVRNQADYHLDIPLTDVVAVTRVAAAESIIRTLDDLAAAPAILAQVIAAIRDYERDVLHDVTFRPTP
jgi:uncharacterized protein (UPF0332 family)